METSELVAAPFTDWYDAGDQLVNLSQCERLVIAQTTAPQNAAPEAYPGREEEWSIRALYGGVAVMLRKGTKRDIVAEFAVLRGRLIP